MGICLSVLASSHSPLLLFQSPLLNWVDFMSSVIGYSHFLAPRRFLIPTLCVLMKKMESVLKLLSSIQAQPTMSILSTV